MVSATEAADLFGTPLVRGLGYRADFIGEIEERALIAHIDDVELTPFRFQRWTGKRLTRSFGWTYDFETGRFGPTEPLPDWLEKFRARAAGVAGLDPLALVQAMLIRYDVDARIGWHRDRPVFEHVIGTSLGASATMRFRQRAGSGFVRVAAPLGPRSLYHISGPARHEWEHSIAPVKARRYSITFRSLAKSKHR